MYVTKHGNLNKFVVWSGVAAYNDFEQYFLCLAHKAG